VGREVVGVVEAEGVEGVVGVMEEGVVGKVEGVEEVRGVGLVVGVVEGWVVVLGLEGVMEVEVGALAVGWAAEEGWAGMGVDWGEVGRVGALQQGVPGTKCQTTADMPVTNALLWTVHCSGLHFQCCVVAADRHVGCQQYAMIVMLGMAHSHASPGVAHQCWAIVGWGR
jgi:hypothetical protein